MIKELKEAVSSIITGEQKTNKELAEKLLHIREEMNGNKSLTNDLMINILNQCQNMESVHRWTPNGNTVVYEKENGKMEEDCIIIVTPNNLKGHGANDTARFVASSPAIIRLLIDEIARLKTLIRGD